MLLNQTFVTIRKACQQAGLNEPEAGPITSWLRRSLRALPVAYPSHKKTTSGAPDELGQPSSRRKIGVTAARTMRRGCFLDLETGICEGQLP